MESLWQSKIYHVFADLEVNFRFSIGDTLKTEINSNYMLIDFMLLCVGEEAWAHHTVHFHSWPEVPCSRYV